MRILTQNKKDLIETDHIYSNDINEIYAVNSNKTVVIAEYSGFDYLAYEDLGYYNPKADTYYKTHSATKNSFEVCEKVLKEIVKFFNKNPNGIYEMPSQETIENIIKEENYEKAERH